MKYQKYSTRNSDTFNNTCPKKDVKTPVITPTIIVIIPSKTFSLIVHEFTN